VIHGDLNGVRGYSRSNFATQLTVKQSNILVDVTGYAQITDIGLAIITRGPDSIRGALTGRDNSVRWIAPEILSNQGTYSKEADVFSFAGVTIEVRCGQPTRG
jgi:serine/threonine protein kinase